MARSRRSVRRQVSFTKTDTYEGIGQRLIGLCFYVSVVVRRFCLFAMNSLNLSRPRLINLAKIWSHYYFFNIAR